MSRQHIIVVDAEQAILRAVADRLEDLDLVVHTATDGERALEMIREIAPRVVILDIVLPGLNGYQLCRQVHAEFPQLAVLLFSRKNEPADKLWSAEVGAVALFHKTAELNKLIERVVELTRSEFSEFIEGESPSGGNG